MMMKTIQIGILLSFVFLIGCGNKETSMENTLPYFNTYDLTPQWGEDSKVKTHKVAPFQFINQEGTEVSQENYKGKIYVTHFFFTSCTGICAKLIKNMSILQDKFKDDEHVRFLSHSVTPVIDSVPRLKKYADYHHIDSKQWNLVTGNKEEIYKIARESYFADDDYTATQKPSSFIHSENFLLIDPKGHIRGVYNGTLSLEMKRIAKHVQILKKEFLLKK